MHKDCGYCLPQMRIGLIGIYQNLKVTLPSDVVLMTIWLLLSEVGCMQVLSLDMRLLTRYSF